MNLLFFILFSYILGSIPFGKLVGKKYGVDIQKKGSGNIGFTNTLRTLGWKAGVIVLFLDIIKGFIPVKLALQVLSFDQVLIVGVVTILGHVFPIWLKFKGGKGVATGLGIIVALNPSITLIAFVIFLTVFLLTKIISISSIISVWGLVLVSYFIAPKLTVFFMVLAIILTWTHRENISRLIKGTEKRIIS